MSTTTVICLLVLFMIAFFVIAVILFRQGKWTAKWLRLLHYRLLLKYVDDIDNYYDCPYAFLCHFNTHHIASPWYSIYFPDFKSLPEVQELADNHQRSVGCSGAWFDTNWERTEFLNKCIKLLET